jgi:hypothetical protein
MIIYGQIYLFLGHIYENNYNYTHNYMFVQVEAPGNEIDETPAMYCSEIQEAFCVVVRYRTPLRL